MPRRLQTIADGAINGYRLEARGGSITLAMDDKYGGSIISAGPSGDYLGELNGNKSIRLQKGMRGDKVCVHQKYQPSKKQV